MEVREVWIGIVYNVATSRRTWVPLWGDRSGQFRLRPMGRPMGRLMGRPVGIPMGRPMGRPVSHGTSHGNSHGTSHGTSHGNSHVTSHGRSHGTSHGNSHGRSHGTSHGTSHWTSHGNSHGTSHGTSLGTSHETSHGNSLGRLRGGLRAQLGRGHWLFVSVFSRIPALRLGRFYVSRIAYFTYHQKWPRIEHAYFVSVTYYVKLYVFMRQGTAKGEGACRT